MRILDLMIGQFAHVQQPLKVRLKLYKNPEIGDLGHRPFNNLSGDVARRYGIKPWIFVELA